MSSYHVALPDRSSLVLEAEEIARRLARGELPLGCWYWRKGLGTWKHLSEVAELAALVAEPRSSEPSTSMNVTDDDVIRAASSPFASNGAWVEPADWHDSREGADIGAEEARTNAGGWQERGLESNASAEVGALRPSNIPPPWPSHSKR